MAHPETTQTQSERAEIVDFDEVLLDSCAPHERAELLREAKQLAAMFVTEDSRATLLQIAQRLSAGERDGEMPRAQARRLAAALKRLARAG